MSRVAGALGVRPSDVGVTAWLVALFTVTQAGHGLGSNIGDALLFVRFGVDALPQMIALSGVAIMLTTVGYAAVMSRVGLARLLPPVAWGLAALLLVERAAITADRPVIYAAIWLTEQVVVLVTFTMMWGAAADACDARQAKRLYPLLASAGITGGFVGNVLTGPLASVLGTANVLMVHAALLVGVGFLVREVAARFFTVAAATAATGGLDDLRAGLRATRGSPLFRLTAVTGFSLSLLFFLVVVPFAEVVTASFDGDAAVAAFLGYFSAAATAASLVVSLFVTNRLLRGLGVVGAVLIVPVVYGVGFALWTVSFTLATAAVVRGAQWIAVNAIGGTAWQAVFNVVRPPVRGHVMAFITAVPTQLGVVVVGVALTLGIADLPIRWLSLLGAVVAAVTTLVVRRMSPAYVGDLLVALRGGLGDVFSAATRSPRPMVAGRDALSALQAAMTDPQPARRRVAVQLLRLVEAPPPDLLLRATNDEDPQVRGLVISQLADLDDPRAVAAVARALDDADGRVRRAALLAADRSGPDHGAAAGALHDPDPLVRATAAAVVRGDDGLRVLTDLFASSAQGDVLAALDAATRWSDAPVRPSIERLTVDQRSAVRLQAAAALAVRDPVPTAVLPLLDDPEQQVRDGVADLFHGRSGCTGALTAVLRDGSERAQIAAVHALRDDPHAHDALVTWAIARSRRAETVRRYRADLPSVITVATPSRTYLDRVLVQREWQALHGVLAAVEGLTGGVATRLLTRGVRTGDPHLRAQAVEAIDSLAGRPLTQRVLPLLEDDPVAGPSAGDVTAWRVLDDPDEWLRALAVRAAIDQISALRSLVSEHARRDDSPLVAGALNDVEEATVAPSGRPGDLIDRILALQQVPMFSDLPPEDLQHVAERCVERAYALDEVIYRQGDLGDEMLIVTRGQVRISRQVDGADEVLRRYGPGEHVGELSLLRGRPRNADVIADAGGTEGLSLDAAAFRAIIDDRPEVAMAMLATLAERLGTS